jgi:hypothetical protein
MELFSGYYYCIDTSSLINLTRWYPRKNFPSLWDEIEKLVKQRKLIAPNYVLKEIEQATDKKDELLQWAKKNKTMFYKLEEEAISSAKDIVSNNRNLIDINKTIEDADPFVIALSISKKATIITDESKTNLNKIPSVAQKYNIKSMSLVEFIKAQNWKF